MISESECVMLKRRGAEHVATLVAGMSQHEQLEFWQKRTKGDVNAPGGIATEEDRQPERRKALIFGLYLGNMLTVNLWRVAQNRCESLRVEFPTACGESLLNSSINRYPAACGGELHSFHHIGVLASSLSDLKYFKKSWKYPYKVLY